MNVYTARFSKLGHLQNETLNIYFRKWKLFIFLTFLQKKSEYQLVLGPLKVKWKDAIFYFFMVDFSTN